MILAHVPAGYVSGKLINSFVQNPKLYKAIMVGSLVGSLLPDIDMIYWYTIDQQQSNHHIYWTHIPIVYCALLPVIGISCLNKKWIKGKVFLVSMWLNVMLHALLDTFMGGILWKFPFSVRSEGNLISFFDASKIPEIFTAKDVFWSLGKFELQGWVVNMMIHWSFLAEVFIIICAFLLLRKDVRNRKKAKPNEENNIA